VPAARTLHGSIMFEITADDIAALNDGDLRALITRLCEAELKSRSLSSSAVTGSGSQTAADGGLDVRVGLPTGTAIDGFVPRANTGFQVKKPDMPRSAILAEMKPSGALRPVIRELAEMAGAYIIVSADGSTSDSALRSRRDAMREAVHELPHTDALTLDFYDRTRIATWVRSHPGMILWVRERRGRAIRGWRAYGAWAYAPEGVADDYLADDTVRIKTDRSEDGSGLSATAGIDRIREAIREPRQVARLIGLSGLGKTRLAQALFDARIGKQSLDPSLAIYTNLSDDPDPQPVGLASDLIASRTRAVLIVDNCPPDLHHRLSEVARAADSTISVTTVEYDIQDDEPEGTEVFRLEASSIGLIEKLVRRRFPELSQVDAHTVAELSGGNARMAIALAATIGRNETIAGLSDQDLFKRLFQQRHAPDDSLLRIAQACSLVYSFEGETLEGHSAELPVLAGLAGTSVEEVFRAVAELRRRDLVQARGVWRAVLPHGIANRLAEMALENIPRVMIEAALAYGDSERLLRSFSRRLGFLDGSEQAVGIIQQWLGPSGFLKNPAMLNELGRAVFHNVAPVAPLAALEALERAAQISEGAALLTQQSGIVRLVRSLAYDANMFDRAARLLVSLAETEEGDRHHKEASDAFESLFTILLSGTHASIEQRLDIVESLLSSDHPRRQRLGMSALRHVFQAWHFSSHYAFEFGARSRDFGSQPRTRDDVAHWYSSALRLTETFAYGEGRAARGVRDVLAQAFRDLWTGAGRYDDLERISREIAKKGFWREGWIAIRQTRQFDGKGMARNVAERLAALDAEIRPVNLIDRISAIVFSNRGGNLDLDLDDLEEDEPTNFAAAHERMNAAVQDFGRAVANDPEIFNSLLPNLIAGEGKLWGFGRGLGLGAEDPRKLWSALIGQLAATAQARQNAQVLCGFLAALNEKDAALTNTLLDEAVTHPALATWLPILQTAVPVDARGVARLKQALALNQAPIASYGFLRIGRATDPISGPDLKDLLLTIAAKDNGYYVAVEILSMRLHGDHTAKREPSPEVIETGRELLRRLDFAASARREDHNLNMIARASLKGDEGASLVGEFCRKLMKGTADYHVRAYHHHDLFAALIRTQPIAALDALFGGDSKAKKNAIRVINDIVRLVEKNPLSGIPDDSLLEWCERNAAVRYPIMASLITPFSGDEKTPLQWTGTARQLLKQAPDRLAVFKEFMPNFHTTSWSGSLASHMETKLPLLDDPEIRDDSALASFVAQTRARLKRDVESQRRIETERDRQRDESFE
jgi:hypothetical protein